MSTIKSSDEHLTLNADGTSKDIKFQANGVEKASISSAGAFTSTTIDATKLTGDLPAISGANLTGVGVAGISSSADATAITISSSEDVGINHSTGFGTYSGTGVKYSKGDGTFFVGRDGGQPLWLNRETSQGDLIGFAAAGSTYARIGTTSNALVFKTGTGGNTERMRILADGGLTFNGDTAAANALDDYEEGTWTVGWTSTSNTFNPSTTTGYYTKVGNLVTISYHAYLSGAPTINASPNGFSFNGLPFTSSSGKSSTITWGHKRWMEWPSNTTDVMLDIEGASTTIQTLARTSIGELYNIRAVTFSRNGSGISFAGHYYTDS